MKNTIKFNESQLKDIITNVISEEFKSQKLAQLARDNGGLSVSRNGGNRNGANAWQFGRSIDPANVTDDMLVGEPYDYNWDKITPQQRDNAIVFNGTGKNPQERAIQLRNDIEIPKPRQKASRYGSGIGDTGDHDKHVGGFKTKNSITQQSAPYNGFSVSNRAGESQNVRDAINTNQREIDFYKNNPDYDPDGKLTRDTQRVIKNLKKRGEKIKNMNNLAEAIDKIAKKVLREYYSIVDKGDQAIYGGDYTLEGAREQAEEMYANGGAYTIEDSDGNIVYDSDPGVNYQFENCGKMKAQITESQLRDMIVESVKKVLTEME